MRILVGNTSLVGLFTITLLASSSKALELRSYSSATHNRFTSFPGSPVQNPGFIHSTYDFTGVGWHTSNTARQLTMVSPIHFVGANHYKPGIGATIRFVAGDGSIKDYTVASQTAITNDDGVASDLFYGTLSNPIPETDLISFHPYLNLGNERNYRRRDLVILGKTARGGMGELSTTVDISSSTTNSTHCLRWNYSTLFGTNDDAYLESGDSGSPVFIDQGGTAAIVGTNSLVSTSTSTIYNYANFIPYYADKLDTAMASLGYHMTRAIPGSTTLTLTHASPNSIIRAGHPFTINLTLNNTQSTRADNVKLHNSFPAGTFVSSASGTNWFDESTPSLSKARKAFLSGSSSSNYTITLTVPTPGTAQHQVTYSCDQFAATSEMFDLEVIESFISWSSALTDKTSDGDDDKDGVGNLLEYAFGGDPTVSSSLHPGTTTKLIPNYSNNSISYIRRTDAANRALTYQLTSSITLENGSWSDASAMVSQTTTTPIDSQFELVTLDLTSLDSKRFFRIEVTLDE